MTVILKIPKRVGKTAISNFHKSEIIAKNSDNKNQCSMEIVYAEEFRRVNIKFSSTPPDKVKSLLLASNWKFSAKKKLWYPSGRFACEESRRFAELLKKEYFDK